MKTHNPKRISAGRWFARAWILTALAGSAQAASTDTWVGGTGSNFSTTANWTYSSGSGPVATGDSLTFSGAGSVTPNNDETSFTYGGISFTGTTVYGMGGNPFTLASGGIIANSGAVTQTINNNIALTSSGGTINPSVASSGITLGGIISGAANLTKSGNSTSTLTLSGVNTFSGVLTFNAGTVVFATPPSVSGGNLGNPSGITFGGSSTTTLVTTPTAGSVTISSPTITANTSSTALFKNGGASGTTFLISAKITGAGNCKQNTPTTSGAIVRFGGDTSDYTGNFSGAGGIIEYTSVANGGSPSALGTASTAYAIINGSSAVTFRYAGAGVSSTTRNIDWQGTTGSFTLDSGTTASGPVAAFLGTGNLRSANGIATLSLAGSSTGTNTLAQVINDGTTGSATTVSTSGTGTWILRGANTYSGGTTLNTGSVLGIASSTALGTGAFGVSGNGFFDNPSGGSLTIANAMNLSGGSPTFIGSTNLTITGPVTLSGNNRTITVNASSLTLGGQITGAFTLTKAGAGTLVLNNSGTADTQNGTLIGAGTLDLGGTSQTLGAVTFSGASSITNGTVTGTSYSGTLNSGAATVSANLAGSSVTVSHTGSGTLSLLGANTFTGGTTIGGIGTVIITNDAGLGNTSGGVLFSGNGFLATSNFGAAVLNNVTVGSGRTITVNSAITAGFATLDTNNLTIAAKITGAGGVTRRGSSFLFGNVRFASDTSDYTGDFIAGFGNTEFTSVADQGIASSLGAGAIATGGQIGFSNATSSGTLRYVGAGNSATHRALNWSGTTATFTLDASGAGTIQFLGTSNLRSAATGSSEFRLRGSNTGSNVFAQAINDTGAGVTSVSKFDGGTWVLASANIYSGALTNNAGTLLINGSVGGTMVTNVGGTLGGTGTINSPVAIQSGTLQPGPGSGGIGTLTVNAALTLNSGGTASMIINRTNSQTASLVTGISTVTYGGTLSVSNSGPAPVNGDVFTLFTATSYSGAFATISLPGLSAGLAWDVSQLPVNGTIQVVALPAVTISPGSTNLVYGNIVTLTANATGTGPLSYQWYDNTTSPISGATNSAVTFSPTVAESGTYSVIVTNNFGKATNTATVTVSPANTSLAIGASTNPALPGVNVTFTATVSVLPPGVGMPTGGIQFLTNGTAAGGVVPFTGASAQFSSAILPHGTNVVTAQYAGDANFVGSTNALNEIINTPPVAGTANYSRPRDVSLTIKISGLLTNVTDADGDALALFSFSTNSTNGGTISAVSTNGTFLLYTPPSTNGNVTDSFSYTAEDTFGATNTGTVVISILPDDNGQSGNTTGLTVLGDGTTQIDFAGIPNRTYLVQATTNLTPTISWTTISTNAAGTNGLFQYVDLDATNFTTRYYRTTAP